MAAVRRSCTGSRHSARAQASAPSRSSSLRVRATSLTAERMAGTLTPRKSRSLLRYRLACPARSLSAWGSSAVTTWLAAAAASKTALVTALRYRGRISIRVATFRRENVLVDAEGGLFPCHGKIG